MFRTGGTIAAVRGTELAITAEGDQAMLSVLEGEVQTENDHGSLTMTGGQVAATSDRKKPSLATVARPRDAVRWALYYVPTVSVGPDNTSGMSADAGRRLRASHDAYVSGDVARAFYEIGEVEEGTVRQPIFFTFRASLHLAVGAVEEAKADLARAHRLAPGDSAARALEAIIAVVDGRVDEGRTLAQQAIDGDPDAATARIAMSYVQQAGFDLPGARASLEVAVASEPDNALAWARLAELHSSFGDRGAALDAAMRAEKLEPKLSRTQAVLGFAYLMQVRVAEARLAFETAIVYDQGDPLARLGLALTKIRGGDLEGGRADLEVAASLDPGNSMVRSYLGKVNFEQKRIGPDERELDMARTLDPMDPTPLLYGAIAKQTTNRPVEALDDVQGSIERNDNRAVFRSRLLLDSDAAARGSSLGRVYSDLGFQHLALVEGWHSVNTDPSNSAAHRLLADSYAVRPRHEIARVSELLQSQLLQPSNTTPIQPQLAEGNLQLIAAQGPSTLSFNEFSGLFNSDQVNLQGSILGGQDDLWGAEAIASGIYKRASFSVGYTHFESDGYRVNEDQEDDFANGFVQLEVTPSTSIQGEVRHRETDAGDLELHFFDEAFRRPELREMTENTSGRVGLRHTFSPGSVVLASYQYQDKTLDFFDGADPINLIISTELMRDEQAHSVEGQYLYRTAWQGDGVLRGLNLTAGAGYFDIDTDELFTVELEGLFIPGLPPFPPETLMFDLASRVEHTNLYAYSYLSLANSLTLTLGVSGDLLDAQGEAGVGEREQANPKVGVTWNPLPNTTVRGAAFRGMKRSLVTDATLEPTQVAGFNQFFDEEVGTDSWLYGLALDQRVNERLFAGGEYYQRDLTVPSTFLGDDFEVLLADFDRTEQVGRAYLFAAVHDWLSVSAEYNYEKQEQDEELQAGFLEVETHRVPIGAQFFHPTGLGASFRATYLDQTGVFFRPDLFEFEPGSTDFWVVDAGGAWPRAHLVHAARDPREGARAPRHHDREAPRRRTAPALSRRITRDRPISLRRR